jgi:Fe-S-cluster-containing hydrogenase component 2
MAFKITDKCTACDACRPACPVNAVSKNEPFYSIDAQVCNDCSDVMGGPRCIPACPEAGAIIHLPTR